MYVFLDESGDLGFDFTKNPSKYFAITLLVCHNRPTFFSFKSAIKRTVLTKFNQKNIKTPVSELKGSNTTLSIKQYFYKQLLKFPNQDWEIYSIFLNKTNLF